MELGRALEHPIGTLTATVFQRRDSMKIAIIGAGHMGGSMARRLMSQGQSVTIFNRTPSKAEILAKEGARTAATPAEAARGAEVVITMLADDAAVTTAVMGESGVIRGLAKGAVHMSMSTISPALSARLARAHSEGEQLYVAAPVLGRPDAALAGQLVIVAAGPPAALERCVPIFDALGRETHRVGEVPERANVIKLAANFFIGTVLEALGEAFGLVEEYGVDDSRFLAILNGALFKSPVIEAYGAQIAADRFEPAGFLLHLGAKDLRLAIEAAEAVALSMPLASVLRDRFTAAIGHGKKDSDWSVVGRVSTEKS